MPEQHQRLKALRFHDLSPYRIREVLLVSSPYDAFILEEDGQLTEQVFFEFREVNASGPPRFTHVPTGRAALEALKKRRFDLILVMASLSGMGVNAFARRVKDLRPGRPVVFLALDRKELEVAGRRIDRKAVDGTFLWSGNANILLAIIKLIEDRKNVEHDTRLGNVRVIIMIEDSPRYYSAFLGLLYKELMSQARSLAAEGVNELHRLMYIRSRPKILHATSYEEGMEIFRRFQSNVLAVINDVTIPRGDELSATAGVDFARMVQSVYPDLPVLLQSADPGNAPLAAEIGADFADKNAPNLLANIRSFLSDRLGFGDFVFRLAEGGEVGRARDLLELEQEVQRVPAASVAYHSSHNHFSIWLMARSEYELAERLRPRTTADLGGVEGARLHLVAVLREARRRTHLGHVAELSRDRFDHDLISRTDQGSLGGKGRGIAFLNRALSNTDLLQLRGLPVRLPKTVILTTDQYDEFLDANDLLTFATGCDDDLEIANRFLATPLPAHLQEDLEFIAQKMEGPLAVRSSSLLEDSLHQPFAGIYSTLMIPNHDPDLAHRVQDLANAVRLIYASPFSTNARSYLSSTGHLIEEEKMAVIVQPIVGRRHGRRFYPTFSGVAQSFNFYPIGPQKAGHGIVHLALGLGRMVVDGGHALRFSPNHPDVLPQFSTPKTFLDRSQRTFYALDMNAPCCRPGADTFDNLSEFDLSAAEQDGTLALVGSVYSADERRFREDLSRPGPRVVSFQNILRYGAIPLAQALRELLRIAARGLGGPVEIEFACEMGDFGRPARSAERQGPELTLLQMRPFGARSQKRRVNRRPASGEILCTSGNSLGHGVEEGLRDLIYVRRDRWRAAHNRRIAHEVGELTASLRREGRPYVLIGPGRWGSADDWLGIPVQWSQISGARVIVEASPSGIDVEPSQGTHFFQNITSLEIGYLTLTAGAGEVPTANGDHLDWSWLEAQPAVRESEHLRLLRFEDPLTVELDGHKGTGRILKPNSS